MDIGRIQAALAEIDALVPGPSINRPLEITGEASFASAFDVDTVAFASAAAANLSAGVDRLDRDIVAATFGCHVLVDDEPPPVWAALSGYYDTADGGRMQFHANFEHHRDGIVERLGCEPTRASVQAAVLEWDAEALEAALIADGMIPARLRSLEEWAEHPHALATTDLPLISVERIADGAPRERGRRLRVLDCSRVLAGPVAGQAMAANGNDVLRVGAAHLPSVEIGVISTGFGKRNAHLDLDRVADRATFEQLLATGDVWIDAYRPGAFADRGLPPEAAPSGSVVVQLSAFDWVGPWAGRRGFDSIVQSTTGVVDAGTRASGRAEPVPLPVQALDYATGFLAAATATKLVAHQADIGGTWLARLSLLRTRNWLVGLAPPRPFDPARPPWNPSAVHTVDSPFGALTAPRPIAGAWPTPPQPLGSGEARWSAT